MKVSFTGKVFMAGSTKRLSNYHEIKLLKKFAADSGYDVLVLNRDCTPDDVGRYETIIVKEGSYLGQNMAFAKIFDFKDSHPENSETVKIDLNDDDCFKKRIFV